MPLTRGLPRPQRCLKPRRFGGCIGGLRRPDSTDPVTYPLDIATIGYVNRSLCYHYNSFRLRNHNTDYANRVQHSVSPALASWLLTLRTTRRWLFRLHEASSSSTELLLSASCLCPPRPISSSWSYWMSMVLFAQLSGVRMLWGITIIDVLHAAGKLVVVIVVVVCTC
jgi:hypothetical protein